MNNKIANNYRIKQQITKGVQELETKKTYVESLYEMRDKLISEVSSYIPEYGAFTPVYAEFKNLNKDLNIDKFQIKVFKMPKQDEPDETKRFVEAAVYLPASDYKATLLLTSGNKEQILEQIQTEEFVKKLDKAYAELIDVIQNP